MAEKTSKPKTGSKPAKAETTTEESIKGSRTGVVESDKRDKTRKVVVAYYSRHPKYGKFVRRRTVLHVHDPENQSRNGDVVEVVPCRPMSKTKTWKLHRIVERRAELVAAIESAKAVAESA